MGVIEGNRLVSSNRWEEIKREGENAIRNWINNELFGKSVTIVFIGANTAGRKWVEYEIVKSWNDGKGVLGIYIHNLKNLSGEQSSKGHNPFEAFYVGETKLSKIVKAYDPPYKTSTNVYSHISENLADWIEEAIEIRKNS